MTRLEHSSSCHRPRDVHAPWVCQIHPPSRLSVGAALNIPHHVRTLGQDDLGGRTWTALCLHCLGVHRSQERTHSKAISPGSLWKLMTGYKNVGGQSKFPRIKLQRNQDSLALMSAQLH